MIDEERIDLLVERFVRRIDKANQYILKKMGSSIKELKKLSPTEAQQLINTLKYGGNYEDIVNQLAKYTNLNMKDLEDVFEVYAKEDQLFYKKFYQYRDVPFTPYKDNYTLRSQTQALTNIAENEMYNYSRNNVLGYTFTDLDGNVTFKGIRETYNTLLDNALLYVGTGQETFDEGMSHIMSDIGSSGLKTLQYDTGRSIRLDSAVRMHLNTSLSQLHYENQKIFASEFDFDGWEIQAHANPAPDHEMAQGRQFSIDEYANLQETGIAKDYKGKTINITHVSKKGNVSHRPIGTMNCQHIAFPIILGVSEAEYTGEELQDMVDDAHDTFTFEGKEYTKYEGTQLQRNIERKVRELKDAQILAKAGGNQQLIYDTQNKITQLTNKYRQLSYASGLVPKMERMKVNGYQRTNIKPNIVKFSDEDYYYHNTTLNALSNIREQGLIPKTDIGDGLGLFFGENSERKANNVYGDVELRVLKNNIKSIEQYIGNYYTRESVNIEDIEIKNKKTGKWEKLQKKKK